MRDGTALGRALQTPQLAEAQGRQIRATSKILSGSVLLFKNAASLLQYCFVPTQLQQRPRLESSSSGPRTATAQGSLSLRHQEPIKITEGPEDAQLFLEATLDNGLSGKT